jgi:hypothetical protein
MANSTLTGILIIVLLIDAFCFMGQQAMLETGLNTGTIIGNDAGILEQVNGGNYTINSSDPARFIPGTTPSITTTGNIITDTYNDLRNWFSTATGTVNKGWDMLLNMLGGPYPYIARLGLPTSFSFTIGAIWYLLTIMLIVALIVGRTWM